MRRHCDSRSDTLLALNDDELARPYSVLHDGEPLAVGAEADPAFLDHVVVTDDKHVRASLVYRDRGLGNDSDLVTTLLFYDDAHGLAGGERVVGIGEHRADSLTVRSRIDLHVKKINSSPFAIERAVCQSHSGAHLSIRAGLAVARVEQLSLGNREENLHRIFLHDRREHTGVRPDQIAGRNGRSSDPPTNRRLDFGIGKLDLRIAEVGLSLHDRRLRLTLLSRALIELSEWSISLSRELGSTL